MDDILALIGRVHQGDKEARDILVEKNMGLVHSIARRFQNRGVEMEDLLQIGSIGLLKAIDKFDLSYDVKFSTYAVPMITGEIKRYLRDDGMVKVSRSLKETAARLFTRENMLVGYVSDARGYERLPKLLAAFCAGLPKGDGKTYAFAPSLGNRNEGFRTSSQVNYVARCGTFRDQGFAYTGALKVLKVILNYEYLWTNLRVKGGAYGCMSGFGRSGGCKSAQADVIAVFDKAGSFGCRDVIECHNSVCYFSCNLDCCFVQSGRHALPGSVFPVEYFGPDDAFAHFLQCLCVDAGGGFAGGVLVFHSWLRCGRRGRGVCPGGLPVCVRNKGFGFLAPGFGLGRACGGCRLRGLSPVFGQGVGGVGHGYAVCIVIGCRSAPGIFPGLLHQSVDDEACHQQEL